MAVQRLTKRTVDALIAGERDAFVWDDRLQGFGVKVTPTGKRVYIVQYRTLGVGPTRRFTIGAHGKFTVDEARTEAERVLHQASLGDDPGAEKAARKEAPTVAVMVEKFLANRALHAKPNTVHEYRRLFTSIILPALGERKLDQVVKGDLLALQASLADKPAVANNVLAIVGAMFNYAIDNEDWGGVNPARRIKKLPLPSRKISLKREQYAALGAALSLALEKGLPVPPRLKQQKRGKMSRARLAKLTGQKRGPYTMVAPTERPANPTTVNALRFLALSGWREQEALSLHESAVDFDRGVAILGDSKAGRSVRPLGTRALDVLRETPRTADNPFFFAGEKEGTHLRDANRIWVAAKHAAQIECRLHDLRHSFTSVAREIGYSDNVIAQLVGHTLDGMTSRYGDVPEEIASAAANEVAETIARRLSGEVTNVISLAERRRKAQA